MHIPDNYLSPATCAVMVAAMVPVWVHSVKKVKLELPKEKIPLLGIGAAFSFLGMMFNVPLPGGTTGHAVGGTLLAILFGPEAACLAVSIALLMQSLLFGDGGILAYGANCFNMAFILPFAGYSMYLLLSRFAKTEKTRTAMAGAGAYIGINLAALCAAVEFGIQPIFFHDAAGHALYCPYPLWVSIPAMLLGHLTFAGVAEIILTVAVLSYVKSVSPQLLREHKYEKKGLKPIWALLAVLIAATPLGLLASGTAWGEWGTDEISSVTSKGQSLGYVPSGMTHGFSYKALFSDYAVSGLPDWLGYIISALIGVAILVMLFKIISSLTRKKDVFSNAH